MVETGNSIKLESKPTYVCPTEGSIKLESKPTYACRTDKSSTSFSLTVCFTNVNNTKNLNDISFDESK